MALPTSAFIVKDRLELMEKKLEQVLQEEGLQDLTKELVKKSIASYLTTVKGEINEIVKTAQASIEKEKKIAADDIDSKIENHFMQMSDRVARAEMIAKISAMIAFASIAWNLVSSMM